jgi:hypothetical protein
MWWLDDVDGDTVRDAGIFNDQVRDLDTTPESLGPEGFTVLCRAPIEFAGARNTRILVSWDDLEAIARDEAPPDADVMRGWRGNWAKDANRWTIRVGHGHMGFSHNGHGTSWIGLTPHEASGMLRKGRDNGWLKVDEAVVRKTFADRVYSGEIKADDAVRAAFQTIGEWHDSDSNVSVYEYMCMTAEQYAEFARSPWRITSILRVEKQCNMCGLSLMLDEPHSDGYSGIVDVEARGHYASTPGNGAGALDDMRTYKFSLCEFCVDHLMSHMVIKPRVYEHDMDMNNCGYIEFRPAAQRVKDDAWREMKDKFFDEYERRSAARKLYADPLWRAAMNVAALPRVAAAPLTDAERAMVEEVGADARWIPHDQFVDGLPRQIKDALIGSPDDVSLKLDSEK